MGMSNAVPGMMIVSRDLLALPYHHSLNRQLRRLIVSPLLGKTFHHRRKDHSDGQEKHNNEHHRKYKFNEPHVSTASHEIRTLLFTAPLLYHNIFPG